MSINSGMMSSLTDDWATPIVFFNQLNEEFHFTLDPCAYPYSAKCDRYFTAEDDGLVQDWGQEVVFMNPPYGRGIGVWLRKARLSALAGATVVCLIPSRTDTAWWHEEVMLAAEIRLVVGRLTFGDATSAAPFPSAVVVFRPGTHKLVVSTMEQGEGPPPNIDDLFNELDNL